MTDNEFTNDDFWDCECDTEYIHTKQISECSVCGAKQEDQPDSFKSEVDNALRSYIITSSATAVYLNYVDATSVADARKLLEDGYITLNDPVKSNSWEIVDISEE